MTHEVIRAGALINKHRLVMISCALEGHVKAFLIDKHFTAFPSARLLVSVSVKGERKAEGLLKRSGSHPPPPPTPYRQQQQQQTRGVVSCFLIWSLSGQHCMASKGLEISSSFCQSENKWAFGHLSAL